ncbi:radical SAM protein [Polyangium mundeleinium]|uniref:Radical SAM protein n=1 Tax=Polyangium mundeleinium TaxID=2995306 RepID=A0ABT5EH69_9BACT|nr:radical SAM protein [Polyangium mundeleinium]MDC0741173.1 radical SAM protein [Polyangium mundeleinium]
MRWMRVARVLTNETCNQGCGFCSARRPVERPDFVRPAAVLARIDEALAKGTREVVLTGGEPTMRRDLAALVRHARARGAERVVLETNASLVTESLARALADAGLSVARVHVPAFGPEADGITRDEGGFSAALAGARALAAAGIPLEITTPIVRNNLDLVAAIPGGVRAANLPVLRLVASMPVDAPDPATLAPLEGAARALERLDQAAREAGIPLSLDPGAAIPPCSFERPARLAHLYALNPGGANRPGHERVPACGACVVADRCPGVPRALLARETTSAFRPLMEDRIRRKLTVISSVREQIDRELVTRDVHRAPDGRLVPSHIVRIQFQCNQACDFCFVSTHLPAPEDEVVRRAILEIAHAGGVLQVSGGEPTLNGRLREYVALAKREGAIAVELQTNAVRLADPGRARELEEAGLDVAFVSLHGSRAEISDVITRAPGTFEKTARGLDALAQTKIRVRLNFVFCEPNQADFPDFVRLVAARWPAAEINVSVVGAFTDLVPRTESLIPRYTDLLPAMREGLMIARATGIPVLGFESMCGIPLCLAPVDPRGFFDLAEIPNGHDGGEFVRAEACGRCELSARCFGLRRSYAELHGTSEARAVVRGAEIG